MLLDGELSETEKDEIQNHIESCPSCRAAWQSLVRLDSITRRTVVPDPGKTYWDSLPGRITTQLPVRDSSARGSFLINMFWRRLKTGYKLAAFVACAVILFVVAMNIWTPERADRLIRPSPSRTVDAEAVKDAEAEKVAGARSKPTFFPEDRLSEEISPVRGHAETTAGDRDRMVSTEKGPLSAAKTDEPPAQDIGASKGTLPAERYVESEKRNAVADYPTESDISQAGSRRELDERVYNPVEKPLDRSKDLTEGGVPPVVQKEVVSGVVVPSAAGQRRGVNAELAAASETFPKPSSFGLVDSADNKKLESQWCGLDTLRALQRIVASLENENRENVRTLTNFSKVLREVQAVGQTPEEKSEFIEVSEKGTPVFEQSQLYNQLVNDFGAEDFRSLALRYYSKNAEILRRTLGDSVYVQQFRQLQE